MQAESQHDAAWSFTGQHKNVFFVGPADGTTDTQTVEWNKLSSTRSRSGQTEQRVTRSHRPTLSLLAARFRDHSLFRSRYVVAAAETIQFSETDDIFNFFNDASVAVQATDPFGLRGTSERSSPIEWIIPVEDSILAFSSTTQFQVRAADADVLTPLTGEIFRLSNLEMNSQRQAQSCLVRRCYLPRNTLAIPTSVNSTSTTNAIPS